MFQSLKGFQRFCGIVGVISCEIVPLVSIPKRVSEVLWLRHEAQKEINILFQSLKGFQRFCGSGDTHITIHVYSVSIPKRVSEVLWPSSLILAKIGCVGFNP